MIVVSKDATTEQSKMESKASENKETFEDMFRKELDAYCVYKDWKEETDDSVLEMALEEMMIDEYLHAKFLRDYMKENDMYTISESDPHEKKFWKIQKKIFRD